MLAEAVELAGADDDEHRLTRLDALAYECTQALDQLVLARVEQSLVSEARLLHPHRSLPPVRYPVQAP